MNEVSMSHLGRGVLHPWNAACTAELMLTLIGGKVCYMYEEDVTEGRLLL
jgi:hypothetical protein